MKKLLAKETSEAKLSFNFIIFPDCCVAGLASNFQLKGWPITEQSKENAIKELEKKMTRSQTSVTILMDCEEGSGFLIFKDSPKIQFLSSTFNKNSGNVVYLMQYTL